MNDRSPVILVVEDEDVIRGLVRRILEAEGYTVLTARDGAEGLEMCRQRAGKPVDLLVTDLVVPGIGGADLAARVRSLWPQVPILWMSGYGEGAAAQLAKMPENTEFIQKPFPPAELVRRVRGLI